MMFCQNKDSLYDFLNTTKNSAFFSYNKNYYEIQQK